MRVMNWVGRFSVMVGAMGVAGCSGGYTQEMYLRPAGVEWPAVSKVVMEVRIKGDADVAGEVGKVAEGLGLRRDEKAPGRWWVKRGGEQFSISLGRMKSGVWDVQLTDWPGVTRSGLSERAEKEIVAAVHGVVVVVKK
ncbi:MAG: hypothetical protein ACTHN5_02030 [Phycisphaerae bacterium]